jgi:hypothetical protein
MKRQTVTRRRRGLVAGAALLALSGLAAQAGPAPPTRARTGIADGPGEYVVFGTNDLGMHCTQQDFTELMILPPYNTLHAQVIRRGVEPEIIDSDVTVGYALRSNTRSSDKTNFWTYADDLFGVTLAPDVGLTGHGMSGSLSATPNRDWNVTGIPVTPIEDSGRENTYPLATITVRQGSQTVARTQAVVPVSWEMNCNLCHTTPGISIGLDILRSHDALHGTHLEQDQPVNCSGCHADPALGAPGLPGVPTMSSAMHAAHAPRMGVITFKNECYACHPGLRTQCQRDVHFALGMTCTDCHGDMTAVGNPARTPWVDEPRCGDCHVRPGFEFEQPGALFRGSVGHGGVTCLACHGSPHAVTPTVTPVDNLQAVNIQGYSGPIQECLVCHTQQPGEPFFHRRYK